MAGTARGDVEILVHTTAPSRGHDDARYRALAQVYLNFEPLMRIGLEDEPGDGFDEDVVGQLNSQLQEELLHSTLDERESEESYRPDDEVGTESVDLSSFSLQHRNLDRVGGSQFIESPALSFNSALDNANSPAFRRVVTCSPRVRDDARQQSQESLWLPPPSEIADSQPENDQTIPTFSTPTPVLELYLQQIESSEERSSSDIRRNDSHLDGPSPELPVSYQQSHPQFSKSLEEHPSSTTDSSSSPSPSKSSETQSQRILRVRSHNVHSTKDSVLSSKRKLPELSPEDTYLSSSALSKLAFESSVVTSRSTRSRKRQCTEAVLIEEEEEEKEEEEEVTASEQITSSKFTVVATSSASNITSVWAGKIEIRPPPPETSTTDLTLDMLITPSLEQLAQQMTLSALFRPLEQIRDLRPMERGHWLLSCQTWNPGLQKRGWDCLGNFVGRGMAGWGVSCIRDEAFENMRVYCWGTVVGHVYLLLYMASESKIKGTGACWIGGDGKPIIKMAS